jgi:hypothetical protein
MRRTKSGAESSQVRAVKYLGHSSVSRRFGPFEHSATGRRGLPNIGDLGSSPRFELTRVLGPWLGDTCKETGSAPPLVPVLKHSHRRFIA